MMQIDTRQPVLVTGASGYVAGWVVRRCLEEGLTVHAAVRDPDDAAKTAHLLRMGDSLPGSVRLFHADLLDEGSYAQGMAGCQVVFHTASPFTLHIRDPQRQLVDPAVNGTRNVLEEATRTGTVRRVVLTSSCAAIYGDNIDLEQLTGGILTEAIWNASSSLGHQPYAYSKTLAEQEAWRIAESQQQWDLVTINPSFVIGPGTTVHPHSESFRLVRQFGDGTMRTGLPDIGIGAVDVRDVAEAHLRAAFVPEAYGRYITSGHNSSIPAIAGALLDKYGDRYPLPRRILPKPLVWLIAPLVNKAMTRRMVARNVGKPWRADNSKIRRELGIEFRPLQGSMEEMFQQMIDAGFVPQRP